MSLFSQFVILFSLAASTLAYADQVPFYAIECIDQNQAGRNPVYFDLYSAQTWAETPFVFDIGNLEPIFGLQGTDKHSTANGAVKSVTVQNGVATIAGAYGTKLVVELNTFDHPGRVSGPVDAPGPDGSYRIKDYPVTCQVD